MKAEIYGCHQPGSLISECPACQQIARLKEENDKLRHDLNNAVCASKMAMELVGRCKNCGNRTEIQAGSDEVNKLLGDYHIE